MTFNLKIWIWQNYQLFGEQYISWNTGLYKSCSARRFKLKYSFSSTVSYTHKIFEAGVIQFFNWNWRTSQKASNKTHSFIKTCFCSLEQLHIFHYNVFHQNLKKNFLQGKTRTSGKVSVLPVEHDNLSDENNKRKQKRATLENVVIQESSLNL